MVHAFDSKVAMAVGVKGAILLHHIGWWVAKNAASEINFHDGYYWTYNTSEAFAKLFPFWTSTVIRKELKRLEAEGYLKAGFFNKSPMDRTKWYTLTQKARTLVGTIGTGGLSESAKRPNGNGEKNLTSIDINKHSREHRDNNIAHLTVSKTENPMDSSSESKDKSKDTGEPPEGFTRFWAIYPRKVGKKEALKAYTKLKPSRTLIEKMILAISVQSQSRQWQRKEFIPHPATWLNGERWNDDLSGETYNKPTTAAGQLAGRKSKTWNG